MKSQKKKDELVCTINKTIPDKYINNIKVICLDLKLPSRNKPKSRSMKAS